MPSISAITPATFDSGRSVTLSGSGFGASQGQVLIAGQVQTITSWSDTSITFTTVRGSQSLGACRVDVVGGASYSWVFEGLTDGLTGLTSDTSFGTVVWDAGGFARFTSTGSGGVLLLQRSVSSPQLLVRYDIRRHQQAGSKQLKITGATDSYISNFTAQTASYNSVRFNPSWSDDSDGGDNDIEVNFTGVLTGGTSFTRAPFTKSVYQANITDVVQDVTGTVWETWQIWTKHNTDNTQDGEVAVWKNGVLILHLTNVWNCATTNTDGVHAGVSSGVLSNYQNYGRVWLFGYTNAGGVIEDYRNLKIGYDRPAGLA